MSIRKISFTKGEFYHIYNRGNDKRLIFHDKQDYSYFISLLFIANSNKAFNIVRLMRNARASIFSVPIEQDLISIGAYVLMSNHFHILIIQKQEGGISKFMQKICTGYVMYYNKKYKHSGSLFEGKFKSRHLNTDKYLKYIFSYIHLNPVKLIDKFWKERGIKNINKSLSYLNNYEYSSFIDYSLDFSREESVILEPEYFPDYFLNESNLYKEMIEWLSFKDVLGKT